VPEQFGGNRVSTKSGLDHWCVCPAGVEHTGSGAVRCQLGPQRASELLDACLGDRVRRVDEAVGVRVQGGCEPPTSIPQTSVHPSGRGRDRHTDRTCQPEEVSGDPVSPTSGATGIRRCGQLRRTCKARTVRCATRRPDITSMQAVLALPLGAARAVVPARFMVSVRCSGSGSASRYWCVGPDLDIYNIGQGFQRLDAAGHRLRDSVDLDLLRHARRALLPPPLIDRPQRLCSEVFPTFRRRPASALRGRRIAVVASGGAGPQLRWLAPRERSRRRALSPS
jgi:hypothetical protein